MTFLQRIGPVRTPPGVVLIDRGTCGERLPFSLPPPIALRANYPREILNMLKYAGFSYQASNSDAALFGIDVFRAGRDFVLGGNFECVTFDWDHTLSNYQIFEHLPSILRAKCSKAAPAEEIAQAPMTAIEIARPFMQELAFGMMVGFAVRQGLRSLDQWEDYRPQVGLVTHTWPDRLGVLASYFVPLLPLLEGFLPGRPETYERMTDPAIRSTVHLHHFLDYAERLVARLESGGIEALTPSERKELRGYFKDGKAHYRKPIGALAERGWKISSLLHFDDSTRVVENYGEQAALVRQPHSSWFRNVQEWHKIAFSALWRSRDSTARSVVEDLARMEWSGSTMPALIAALEVFSGDSQESPDLLARSTLPPGVVMAVHETPTTVGEFWRYYVEPTNRAKSKIRAARSRWGKQLAQRLPA